MKIGYVLLASALLLALGYGVGRHLSPEKKIEVEKEVSRVEYVDVVREIIRPDGTKEKEIRKEVIKEIQKESISIVENKTPQYELTALYGKSSDGRDIFGVMVERRMFANIKAGVWANTEKQLGIGISYEW